MSSVTNRISEIKQPRGGYLKPTQFEVTQLDDGKKLNLEENLHATVIGITVDYLTRYINGTSLAEAFRVSRCGALTAVGMGRKDSLKEIQRYLDNIKGLDDISIVNACKCATFDTWFRNPMAAYTAKQAVDTMPDSDTIENIRIMVERGISFFKLYGPIVKEGFTFEPYGYTETVDSGDGDLLTADTLWDFKVSKNKPTNKHTLQLLMYWIMGQHSKKDEFKNITKIGVFNPRLNNVYTLRLKDVPPNIIKAVEEDVICYR